MPRRWRVPKSSVIVLLIGALAWLVPLSSSGAIRFDCGPAITAAFGITRPPDPDRFIPQHPGGDTGTVASQSCKLRSALPVVIGAVALLVGGVGIAAAWSDRRKHPISLRNQATVDAAD